MKIPEAVSVILDRLESNGFEAFVVGGCVRDSLLGKTPADWDVCTSAKPDEIQSSFHDFSVIPTGLKHGTITVISDGLPIEVTTYRQDGEYLDNRHPISVTYTKHLLEDLKRRDFTMNAMAYSPQRGVVDQFHGEQHLNQRILCCVGDATQRFTEDALRILRGLRFAATYKLTFDPETESSIHQCKNGLHSISAERIYAELQRLFVAPDMARILSKFPDILSVIFPTASDYFEPSEQWDEFLKKAETLPPSFPLRFSAFLYPLHSSTDVGTLSKEILNSLKPDKKTRDSILKLIECQTIPLPKSLAETRRFVGKYGVNVLEDTLLFHRVILGTDTYLVQSFLKEIQTKNLCCTIKDLAISGTHLQDRGLNGIEIGATLQRALDAVIDGSVPNTENSLIIFLFS